jgi:hypothetical protein
MGIGGHWSGTSNIEEYFYLRNENPFAIAWWVTI